MSLAGCPDRARALWHRLNARDIVIRQVTALATGIRRSVVWQLCPDEATEPDPYEFLRLMFARLDVFPYRPDGRYPAADAFADLARCIDGAEAVRPVELPGSPGCACTRSPGAAGRSGRWPGCDTMASDPIPRPGGSAIADRRDRGAHVPRCRRAGGHRRRRDRRSHRGDDGRLSGPVVPVTAPPASVT